MMDHPLFRDCTKHSIRVMNYNDFLVPRWKFFFWGFIIFSILTILAYFIYLK